MGVDEYVVGVLEFEGNIFVLVLVVIRVLLGVGIMVMGSKGWFYVLSFWYVVGVIGGFIYVELVKLLDGGLDVVFECIDINDLCFFYVIEVDYVG